MPTDTPKNDRMQQLLARVRNADGAEIDALYGLEPVFEPTPADARSSLGEFAELQCPWCGEVFGTAIDLTTGDRAWIEDCQVCCRPMRVQIEVDAEGVLASALTERED